MALLEKFERLAAKTFPHKSIKMRNSEAVVSFTFDDFPLSAFEVGAKVMDKYGFLGTYYTCGGLWDKVDNGLPITGSDGLKALRDSGHEIGCHTYDHIDCQRTSSIDLSTDIKKNQDAIEQVIGEKIYSFAYPFGKMNMTAQRLVAKHYATARSVVPGLNQGSAGLYALRAYSVYSAGYDIGSFEHILKRAIETSSWVIFYTHDISDSPLQFGCTPREFEELLEVVKSLNISVLPVKHALGYVGFSAA